MLVDQLKKARMTAMKERNMITKSILTTLLGELEGNAKRTQCEISDDMVIKTSKKFVASNLEVIGLGNSVDQLTKENIVLGAFIPTQLSEDELHTIIAGIEATNLGAVMQYLKANHDGCYDGKLASGIAKQLIG